MLEKAIQFAKLLDQNLFDQAQVFLSSDVQYLFRGKTISGVGGVMSCYKDSHDKIVPQLDELFSHQK